MNHRLIGCTALVLGFVVLTSTASAQIRSAQIASYTTQQQYLGTNVVSGDSPQIDGTLFKAPCDPRWSPNGCSSGYLLKLAEELEGRVDEHLNDLLKEYYSTHTVCNANETASRNVCGDAESYARGVYAQAVICHYDAYTEEAVEELLALSAIRASHGECADLADRYDSVLGMLEAAYRFRISSPFIKAARSSLEHLFIELALCEIEFEVALAPVALRVEEILELVEDELARACSPGSYLERRYGSQVCTEILLPQLAQQAGTCEHILAY